MSTGVFQIRIYAESVYLTPLYPDPRSLSQALPKSRAKLPKPGPCPGPDPGPASGPGSGPGSVTSTVVPEIRFFQSIKIFLRTRKKDFFGSTNVFWFKMFSPFRSSRTRKKTFWFKKHFPFKRVFPRSDCFFRIKMFSVQIRPDSQKNILVQKKHFWFKSATSRAPNTQNFPARFARRIASFS